MTLRLHRSLVVSLFASAMLVTTSCTHDDPIRLGPSPLAGLSIAVPPGGFVPGQSYSNSNGYIEYIAGNLPVIFSAPHGGSLRPADIPVRVDGDACGGEITNPIADSNTQELVRSIQAAFFARTGKYPHIIINKLHRDRLDANRDSVEAACGNPAALEAWRDYHSYMAVASAKVIADHGRGWYTDMHGQAHAVQRLELGYELTAASLRRTDAELDASSTYQQSSSIRTFSEQSATPFSALLRGPTALGTLLAAAGYPSTPSQQDPAPDAGESYFNGGFNTERYACSEGGPICGVQIEANFAGVRDNATNRLNFSSTIVSVYTKYLAQFGITIPVPPPPAPGQPLVIQNNDAANNPAFTRFAATSNWSAASNSTAYRNSSFRLESGNLTTPANDGAEFFFYVSTPGTYSVDAWWPASSVRSNAAAYRIFELDGTPQLAIVTANQQTNGGKFNRLGTYRFSKIGWGKVMMTRSGSTTGSLAADAVQVTLVTGDQTIAFSSAAPAAPIVGNSYGVTAVASSGLAVAFGTTTPAVCTITGSTVTFVAAGSCVVTANQAGSSQWTAAPAATQTMTVGLRPQSITITSEIPSAATVGDTYTPSATASSGLAVSFGTETPAVCTASAGTITFIASGNCVITASQAGSATWQPASEVTQTVAVAQRAQSIAFTSAPPSPAYVTLGYTVSATATSGLDVSYSSLSPSVCTLTGTTVAFVGAGVCSLAADQAGSVTWAAAPQAVQQFAVSADDTPPVITVDVDGATGANGWYVGNVGVTWTVADGETPVSSRVGCTAVTISSDTMGQLVTCTAASAGGSTARSVTIKRDVTKPLIGYTGNAGSYTVDAMVNITCSRSDATSGIASSTCTNISAPASSFTLGENTFSAAATDHAGNSAYATTKFTLRVTTASLCTLTKQWSTQAGIGNSLCAKLDAADRAASRGDANAAANVLQAYVHEVQAQAGKSFTVGQAATLVNLATSL